MTKLGVGGLQVTSVQPGWSFGLSDERLLKREGRDSRFQSGECGHRFAVKTSDFECGQHDFFFSFFQLHRKAQGLLVSLEEWSRKMWTDAHSGKDCAHAAAAPSTGGGCLHAEQTVASSGLGWGELQRLIMKLRR